MAKTYSSTMANASPMMYGDDQKTIAKHTIKDSHIAPNQILQGTKSSLNFYRNAQDLIAYRKKLLELPQFATFSQFATTNVILPKNQGTEITFYKDFPILSDKNSNNQGLDAEGKEYAHGNLYGSSKNISLIKSRLPFLTELGGRVNRVGITKDKRSATLQRFGMFSEWSTTLRMQDPDGASIQTEMTVKLLEAANQVREDALQIMLLESAGTTVMPGTNNAVSREDMDETNIVSDKTLNALHILLNELKVPKQTTVITGSSFHDTVTLGAVRYLITTPEVGYMLEKMDEFKPVEKYAAGGKTLHNEIGALGKFRIIVEDNMLKWEGVGKETTNPDFLSSVDPDNPGVRKLDVHPMLHLGKESFATLGFHTESGSNSKGFFNIQYKPAQVTKDDPYGDWELVSLQFFLGIATIYPERIALVPTVVKR